MTKTIQKIKSITKSVFPNSILYMVWNIDEKAWFGTYSGFATMCSTVWNDKKLAKKDAECHKVINYEIVEISLTEIHQDLIRIANLDENFMIKEKEQMIISKLTQLIKIQILGSKELKDQMIKKYKKVQ